MWRRNWRRPHKTLWDIGFRSPGTMKRRASIPQRSAEHYIKEFREGGDHTRKKYNLRKKHQQSLEVCLDYIYEAMPQTLLKPEWPSYSPDLSPIENIWGWLKVQMNKDLPKSVKALKNSIKKH